MTIEDHLTEIELLLRPGSGQFELLDCLNRVEFWLQVLVIALIWIAALGTAHLVILAMRSSKFFG